MNSQIVTFMSLMLWMNKLSSKQTTSRPRFIKTAWTFDTGFSKGFDWSTYITCAMIMDHHVYEHIVDVNKQKHHQLKGKLIQKYFFKNFVGRTKRKEAGPLLHLHKFECLIPSISKWGRRSFVASYYHNFIKLGYIQRTKDFANFFLSSTRFSMNLVK